MKKLGPRLFTPDERETIYAVIAFLGAPDSKEYDTYLAPNEWISDVNTKIEGAIFLDLIDHSEMG